MANVKNFGLVGVGSDLQLGKAGTRIVNNAGTFNFKAANGTTDAALTAAGITSSAGNVTLTSGNLVLSAAEGKLVINSADMLEQATGGYLKFSGTAAVILPTGNDAARPSSNLATGMMRTNTQTGAGLVEFYDGTQWRTLATGGSTAALQAEIDALEVSLGAGVNSDGTFNAAGFPDVTGVLVDPTSFTDAINQLATAVDGNNSLDEIFPSGGIGHVIYADSNNEWATALPGATSGVQAYDTALASLAANSTFGILAQTDANTVVGRSLVQPAAGITITNADAIAGNPTFALANDLAALEGLSSTGFAVRTAADTWAQRSITGSAGRIVVTNGDGVASSPTIDLDTLADAGTGTFVKITRDSYGRVEGTTAVVASDITGLVDGTYVNVTGDTMTGNLDFGGTSKVTGLAAPTAAGDAANKAYVDAIAAGLTWKTAVKAATTTNVDLSTEVENGDVLDGVTLTTGDRILVKNQTLGEDNGIYIVAATGAPTRATDADTPSELDGAAVFVQQGTANADSGWVQTATIVTVGTTPQVWAQFSGSATYVWGDGLLQTGNTISVNMGAGVTTLPSDEVGLDIVSNQAIQLTSTATNGQLTLVLDGSSLTQSSSGLAVATAGVTNAMLVNDGITLDADSGTGNVDLGGTLDVVGTAAQGIVTSVTGSQIAITASNASSSQKGVASFQTGEFVVTSGNVEIGTVPVDSGGTGVTSFTATQVLFGGDSNTVDQDASFTFDLIGTGSDIPRLTVGGIDIGSSDPTGNAVVIANQTNGDIVLMPNGSGSVVIGPVGAGLIESDAGTALTVRGNTGLTLDSGTGALTLDLPAGTSTSTKVTITGPTAADYATNLDDVDLVNKYYVDQAIQSGAASGAIKAVKATVDLSAAGTTNIGAALPAGATILSVKVQVTSADSGTGDLSVGKTGSVSAYMTTSENDIQTTGMYIAETYVVEAGSVQVIATVGGTPASGSANVIVEYQVA